MNINVLHFPEKKKEKKKRLARCCAKSPTAQNMYVSVYTDIRNDI